MCVSVCFCAHECGTYECRKRASDSWEELQVVVSHLNGRGEPNLGLPQEQHAFLMAGPPLQPPTHLYKTEEQWLILALTPLPPSSRIISVKLVSCQSMAKDLALNLEETQKRNRKSRGHATQSLTGWGVGVGRTWFPQLLAIFSLCKEIKMYKHWAFNLTGVIRIRF